MATTQKPPSLTVRELYDRLARYVSEDPDMKVIMEDEGGSVAPLVEVDVITTTLRDAVLKREVLLCKERLPDIVDVHVSQGHARASCIERRVP